MLDRSESLTSHVTTLSQNWVEYQKKMINLKDQLDKVEGKVIKTDYSLLNIRNMQLNLSFSSIYCIFAFGNTLKTIV